MVTICNVLRSFMYAENVSKNKQGGLAELRTKSKIVPITYTAFLRKTNAVYTI